jgi:rhamnosyltransferase
MNTPPCAAVVILFHPKGALTQNINSFLQEVGKVYIFDNSPKSKNDYVEELKRVKKVEYVTLGRNVGIAKALNEIAKIALLKGYQYLLTMDQDSYFPFLNLDHMISLAMNDARIGIVSPVHRVKNDLPEKVHGESEEILTTMTSGNLLNLKVWNDLGGFDEKLFIDYVDHEYCLRMNKNGYKVVRANDITLEHTVGELKPRKFFFWTVRPLNHPPFRLFYQTRNRFYLKNIYGKDFSEYFRRDTKLYWRGIAKVLLYESQKIMKIRMVLKGFLALWQNDFNELYPNNGVNEE